MCNSRREHLEIQFDYGKNSLIMEETFPNKGILEKTNKKRQKLSFLYNHQQS
jgi:hypothetical protein